MKAAIIEQYGSVVVKEMPEPVLGDYDARCEMLYGATCTATDSHIIAGNFPWLSPLPTVLGHESVGRVTAVGKKVRNFRVGDVITRVGTPPSPDGKISVNWGGFAEVGIAVDHWAMAADGRPENEWKPHRRNQVLPAGVDPRIGPMFITWRETMSCIQRLGVGPGATLLVIGSGGNGLSFAAHARNLGAAQVAMVGAARLREAAMAKAGVNVFLDYRDAKLAEQVKDLRSDGFDFVIDALGRVGMADLALPALKLGGKYCTYGTDEYGKVLIRPTLARGPFTVMPAAYDEAETHQIISELVQQGKLDVSLWYDPEKIYPLADISRAFDDVVKRRTAVKTLIRLGK